MDVKEEERSDGFSITFKGSLGLRWNGLFRRCFVEWPTALALAHFHLAELRVHRGGGLLYGRGSKWILVVFRQLRKILIFWKRLVAHTPFGLPLLQVGISIPAKEEFLGSVFMCQD